MPLIAKQEIKLAFKNLNEKSSIVHHQGLLNVVCQVIFIIVVGLQKFDKRLNKSSTHSM